MKQVKLLFLVATMVFTASLAKESFGYDDGDYSYSYDLNTKEGVLIGYAGTSSNISIPTSFTVAETYKDEDDGEVHTRHHVISVTKIGSSAFANKQFIKTVSFHDKIKSIGSSAFRGCVGLTRIETPVSLGALGASAFQDCTGLEEVVLNGTGLDLYDHGSIFFGCTSLRRVTFGDGVTRLYKWSTTDWYSGTFRGCMRLEYVSVGTGVTEIPPYFLAKCGSDERNLTVSFASPITNVGDNGLGNSKIVDLSISLKDCRVGSGAFSNCPGVSLDNIDFSEIVYIDTSGFEGCVNLKGDVDVSRVPSIGRRAFRGCTGLTSVKFSKALEAIGDEAFRGCVSAYTFVFTGSPPSVGSSAFNNVKSGAVGTYTAEHTTEWEDVIDNRGYWNGLKMKPAYYTVVYDANNGSGARSTATAEWGVPMAAGVGTFTWEAHYFMGWALEVSGGNIIGANEALPEPQDGNITTLYGQCATFEAVSADWQAGSITLKATGVTAKEGEDFFLSYCEAASADSAGAHWEYVENVGKVIGGNVISVTDAKFSERLGGVPAVKYRLQIGKSVDDIRATLYCTTRTRHGIFVGLGAWSIGYRQRLAQEAGNDVSAEDVLEALPGANDVDNLYSIALKYGGFIGENIRRCVDAGANVEGVDNAFADVQASSVPGDICVVYVSTHGGVLSKDSGKFKKGTAVLSLYDDDYSEMQLSQNLSLLHDVAVVCIVSACHAGALYSNSHDSPQRIHWYLSNGLAMCPVNVAWITGAGEGTSGNGLFDMFLFDYGWEKGWAGVGDTFTFFDLATYAKARYDSLFTGFTYEGEMASPEVGIENDGLLLKVVAGLHGSHNELQKKPEAPKFTKVSQGVSRTDIKVSWGSVSDADKYCLFYKSKSDGAEGCFDILSRTEYVLNDDMARGSSVSAPISFVVRAFNGAGVSETSIGADGWVNDLLRKVTFRGNGGLIPSSWDGTPISGTETEVSTLIPQGEKLWVVPTVDRPGFTFCGWFNGNDVATRETVIHDDVTYGARWTSMTPEFLASHPKIASAAGNDLATAANMTAANGCRTVGECYALGIDPEDPNDDFKITNFKIEDGKPVLQLNHMKDGSGNSFEMRIRTLGKSDLSDGEWEDISGKDSSSYRYFKVKLDL